MFPVYFGILASMFLVAICAKHFCYSMPYKKPKPICTTNFFIASLSRVYVSSSAPQSERNPSPGFFFLRSQCSPCLWDVFLSVGLRGREGGGRWRGERGERGERGWKESVLVDWNDKGWINLSRSLLLSETSKRSLCSLF